MSLYELVQVQKGEVQGSQCRVIMHHMLYCMEVGRNTPTWSRRGPRHQLDMQVYLAIICKSDIVELDAWALHVASPTS